MAREISCFFPGDAFPSISTTGTSCSLKCRHCAGRYLKDMIPARTPDELLSVAHSLADRGAKGFLLSGGADRYGRVHLETFIDTLKQVKCSTNLIVNAHIGLSSPTEIADLVDAGIDAFSVDLIGSEATISEVLGIDARPEDYLRVLDDLYNCGAQRVAPHICVGVHGGRIEGEFRAVELLSGLEPEVLVLICLRPTKGTAFSEVPPPPRHDVLAVVDRVREEIPGARVVLGCMRPRNDRSLELDVVTHGVTGLVLPARETLAKLEVRGFSIKKEEVCCALI